MLDRATRYLILILAGMGWVYGCAPHAPDTSEKPSPARASPLATSSIPSKGADLKERLPVLVTSGDRLNWVDNAMRTYPPDRLHTGLGIGPDRITAQDRSLTELEKPFLPAIAERLKSGINVLEATVSEKVLSAAIDRYRQWTLITIRPHARVAEVFLEKWPADTYYALAVLDRQVCSDQLKVLVRGLDHEFKTMVSRLDKTDASVTPQKRSALMDVYTDRLALDASISMLMPEGNENPFPFQAATIGRLVKKK